MDMGYSSEQVAIRDSIRKFLRAENPIAVAREATQGSTGYAVETWKKIADLGWAGIGIPEQYGGGGLGLQELALMYEEFGRALYQGPHFGGAFLCGQLVLRLGSETQKRELLPAMASGRSIMSLALLEKSARWGESGINLRAQRSGEGWLLSGTKLFVTHAMAAHELLCAARDLESGGVTLFRLRDPKSLVIRPMPSTFGTLYYEVAMRKVRLTGDDIIGAPGKAGPALRQVLEWGAAVQCAEMVGLAQSILDMSVEYAKVRVQFGRPIGTYQAMQHVLADMVTRLDCARLLTCQAVSLLADGRPSQRALGMAKAYVNEGAYQIALDGMQVHGGIGYMMEHPLPYYVQRIQYGKMHLGDTDVYLEEVAQALGL